MSNKLILEDSPYLKQHANNPVDWFAWNNEAFQKAKNESKLVFLSIGYSTCHWCHVMEKESFEDKEVATLLNQNFVSIKVDREEMPHIDKYYQDVFYMMNKRSGGWPLSIVMDCDKRVFFSATYIPKNNKYNSYGMLEVLPMLLDAYKSDQETILKISSQVHASLQAKTYREKERFDDRVLGHYVETMKEHYDEKYGGFEGAPKFPQLSNFEALFDIYQLTNNSDALYMCRHTVDAMLSGGIFDQIEGGIYRYSVDEHWTIPHFEKMLYTNAELLSLLAKLYAHTKDLKYQRAIEMTVEFLMERFWDDGLFCSASDADSEGLEGGYFVFEYDKTHEYLKSHGFDASRVLQALDITKKGNFENALSNPRLVSSLDDEIQRTIESLKVFRKQKEFPFIDTKIQTSWNALLCVAFFDLIKYDAKYKTIALEMVEKMLQKLYKNGVLYHHFLGGSTPKVEAYFEDYAFFISVLIRAYDVSANQKFLQDALQLYKTAKKKLYDKDIGWFMAQSEPKIQQELSSNAYQSPLAKMIENEMYLAFLSNDLTLFESALSISQHYVKKVANNPIAYPETLKVFFKIHLAQNHINTSCHDQNCRLIQSDFKQFEYTLDTI